GSAPITSTGVRRSVVVPSPSWPNSLSPQHLTVLALVSAHVWKLPAAIAATPLPRPTTATGIERSVLVPSPSWPYELSPQHLTAPAVVSAQLWRSPVATAATPLPSPTTATGIKWSVLVPAPSSPDSLSPQHLTAPALVSAQVWMSPAASAATPLESPETPT